MHFTEQDKLSGVVPWSRVKQVYRREEIQGVQTRGAVVAEYGSHNGTHRAAAWTHI